MKRIVVELEEVDLDKISRLKRYLDTNKFKWVEFE